MRPLFKLVEAITLAADTAVGRLGGVVQNESAKFDVAVFLRANNILKGAWSLSENNHWELASSLIRQLFELVVNIEWMGR